MNLKNHKYILKNKTPVLEPDLIKWAEWFETASKDKSRIVKQEHVNNFFISTVFLSLDHNYSLTGPPALFETLTELNGEEYSMHRCSTWSEAEEQHKRIVEEIKEGEKEKIT